MSRPVPTIAASSRVIISILCGALAGLITGFSGHPYLALLIAWDITAVTFMVGLWSHIWRMDEKDTAEHARQEDPTRATAYGLLLATSLMSLVAVGVVLARAGQTDGTEEILLALLGIGSVVISWFIVHTLYTLRYADLYFQAPEGGVSFNEDIRPTYSDFAYLAFTLGMTYQVSDTSFGTRKFRKVAISHALFSYLFGTLIVATTINLLAGLGR